MPEILDIDLILGPDTGEINRLDDEEDYGEPFVGPTLEDLEPKAFAEWKTVPDSPPVAEGEMPRGPTILDPDLIEKGRAITPQDQQVYETIRRREHSLVRRTGRVGEAPEVKEWLKEPLDALPTFTEWKNEGDEHGAMESLVKGIGETWGMLKKAGAADAKLLGEVAVAEESLAGGSENFGDLLDGMWNFATGNTKDSQWLGKFGLQPLAGIRFLSRKLAGEEPFKSDHDFEVEKYQEHIEVFLETKRMKERLDEVARAKGLKAEDLENVAEAGKVVLDPTNVVAAGVPFAGAAKLGQAARLGANSARLGRVAKKAGELTAATAWNSPVGFTLGAAGKGVSKVGGGIARAADSPVVSALAGLGGAVVGYMQGGALGGLAGGAVGSLTGAGARLHALGRAGAFTQGVGDMLTTAGRIARAPVQAQALRASFQAETKAGQVLASMMAHSNIASRALLATAAGAKHLGESGVRGALTGAAISGTLGYAGDPTSEFNTAFRSAGGGGAFGLAGSTAGVLARKPLGALMHEPPLSPGRAAFVDEWVRTRPMEEQRMMRSRLNEDQLWQLAQSQTLMGGYLSDGAADINDRYVDSRQFAEAMVNHGMDMLPRSWSRHERIQHMEEFGGGATLAGNEGGRPTVFKNLDADQPVRRAFHEESHALNRLRLPDPNPAKMEKQAEQLSKKYGDDWRVEELTEIERAAWNEVAGDPLAWRRTALDELWFGESGVLNAQAPQLYEQYHRGLGRDVLPIGEMRRPGAGNFTKRMEQIFETGQIPPVTPSRGRNAVVRWEDLTPQQRERAKMQLGDEILAEKTALILEEATRGGGNLLNGLAMKSAKTGATARWLLEHTVSGYASRIQRGAKSVGVQPAGGQYRVPRSDIFQDIGLLPQDAPIIADMLLAKARTRQRAGTLPADKSKADSAFVDADGTPRTSILDPEKKILDYTYDQASASLEAGGYLAEEAFASGLIDEVHYNRSGGEARRNAPRFEAEARKEQAMAVAEALEASKRAEPDSAAVQLLPKGEQNLRGRYFTPDQLNALHNHIRPTLVKQNFTVTPEEAAAVGPGGVAVRQTVLAPRAQKPFSDRMLRTLQEVNEHMLGNQHPGHANRPPLEPLDVQYFEPTWPKTDLNRVEGAGMFNEHILPLQWDITQAKGPRLEAIDWGGLETAARQRLPKGYEGKFDQWRDDTLAHIRGQLSGEKADVLRQFYEPHVRHYDLARIGQVMPTGDLVPSSRQTSFAPAKNIAPVDLSQAELQKILDAYRDAFAAKGSRVPQVPISEIIKRSGLEKEKVHEHLLRQAGETQAVLSLGDFSLSSEEVRAGALKHDRDKFLLVDLSKLAKGGQPQQDGINAPAKGESKAAARYLESLQEKMTGKKTSSEPASSPQAELQKIVAAYRDAFAAKGSRVPQVPISEIIKRSGLDKEKVHEHLLQQAGEARASLSLGDSSLSSEEVRAGALKHDGNKFLHADLSKLAKGDQGVKRALSNFEVRPPTDDVGQVASANDLLVSRANENVPIELLKGGVREDKTERKRLDALKSNIIGEGGYVSRIIIDGENNVVEGQHRLQALQELGFDMAPVVRLKGVNDVISNVDKADAVLKENGIGRREHRNSMLIEAAKILDAEGIEGLREYEIDGYDKAWGALVSEIANQPAAGGGKMDRMEPPQPISPAKLTQEIESSQGYVYHATNRERLYDIADSGELRTHEPSYGTDQEVWPDGSEEKRAYFSRRANIVWQFAPEEGEPVVVRAKDAGLKTESTGDVYSASPIATSGLEYLGQDGAWHPVANLKGGQP